MPRMYPDPDFQAAVEWLLATEGGYVNDPADAGGETNFGISKRAYPKLDIKNLTEAQAWTIYYNDYWINGRCYNLPLPLAWALFDASVNHGIRRAVTILQAELGGLRVDGINGPKTQAAANASDAGAVLVKFLTRRSLLYHDLVTANSTRARFLTGWLTRLFALQRAIYEHNPGDTQ